MIDQYLRLAVLLGLIFICLANQSHNVERCFVALKPDSIQRNLVGKIIRRFEEKGLKLCGMKLIIPEYRKAEEQYIDLKDTPFFSELMKFYCSGPIVATVWEGHNAISISRRLIGRTHPHSAEPGSIRGDYCIGVGRNLVHASDSAGAAEKEINLWFEPQELITYSKSIDTWLYES
jgi:nucleoside-diphosphate kinase